MDIKEKFDDPEFRAPYDKLFQDIGFIIRNHLNTKDQSEIPVLRTLHVLAMHAGVIIAGTNDPKSLEFFSEALNSAVIQVRKDFITKKIVEENPPPSE